MQQRYIFVCLLSTMMQKVGDLSIKLCFHFILIIRHGLYKFDKEIS